MDKFIIKGPCKIKGDVLISGSKNAALPILASTLLFDKPVEIKNLPQVKDISTMISLLKSLNLKVIENKKNKSLKIIKSKRVKTVAPYSLVKTMRASILVLGPLLSKYKKATTSMPGGCLIGARPVGLHLNTLKKLGMKYNIRNGYINAHVKNNLIGADIKISKISVGTTENAILASCLAKGKTVLRNCAIEPEIKDLTNFLNKAGANIKWTGKRTVKIIGVESLKSISYSVMGDRIETGTMAIAAALTNGNLKIKGFNPKLINTELEILKKIGAKIINGKNEFTIYGPKQVKNIKNLNTKEYPGFPTDLQAQFMTLLCKANGRSIITENIFENRFMHVSELQRLGAKIFIKNNKAIIEGNSHLEGAELMSSDLRASVALVLAAMSAKGKSIIQRVYHLDRGYEKLEKKLKKIGVNIKRLT
tara:strand:+ start:8853 stop:10115 length:1263 start_codon:yes stop_codon:yes gene_type:complete